MKVEMIKKRKYRDITERAFEFGVKIVDLVMNLSKNIASIEIGRQLIRSGTAIHSILIHADSASSKKEFLLYNNKAYTEARETESWVKMLVACKLVNENQIDKLLKENNEIISILVSISKNVKKNL